VINSDRFSTPSTVQAALADTAEGVAPEVASAPAETDSLPGTQVVVADPMADYNRLQRRLMLATAGVSALAVLGVWVVCGSPTASSLLLGSCCGLLYLRLLARSVARLGPGSRSIGRFQLLVPVLLVVASSRFPALQLLPALAGFVLYKPALLLQAAFAP
jgi:ATP synthase protein I